jgi:AGZA family xanthine/uracil permease-like MFS transporter
MKRYQWASGGDVNGSIALLVDNLAPLTLLFGIVTPYHLPQMSFNPWSVASWMLLGSVAGVLVAGLVHTVLAMLLARRSGRGDVTAMPMGVDTPSTLAVGLLVLMPALEEARKTQGLDPFMASVFAWNVAMVGVVVLGLFKLACVPFARLLHKGLPRAGLLGSLSGVALALIVFYPLLREVAAAPLVGLPALIFILAAFLAPRGPTGKIPATVIAVMLGLLLYVVLFLLGEWLHWGIVPPPETWMESRSRPDQTFGLPAELWQWPWWERVLQKALTTLPLLVPFGLATVVGGIQCTESAAAEGDDYNPRSILFAQGLATVVAGCCGGVIQTTPYYGHPAYKSMGSRAAFTLVVPVVLGVMVYFGWFVYFFEWFPRAVLFPIIVFVGLRTIARSFEATPARHYPALAWAAVPVLAYVTLIPLKQALGAQPPHADAAQLVQTLYCLGNGFVLTSLLWATSLTAVIDGRWKTAAVCLVIAGAFTLAGLMHSPLLKPEIALPTAVMNEVRQPLKPSATDESRKPDKPSSLSPEAVQAWPERYRYQTPYHWSVAYLLAAGVVLLLSRFSRRPESVAVDWGRKEEEARPIGRTD